MLSDTIGNSDQGLSFWVVVACLLCVIGIGVALAVSQHALEKHSYDALVVDSCLENGAGYLGEFRRDADGRILKVCQIDTESFGIKVQEANKNPVTDFIKEKLKRIDQVLRYVKNRGYEPYDDVAKNIYKAVFE